MGKITGQVSAVAFLLLIVGTVGLLANEFIMNWGRTATLVFAAASLVGLVIVAYSLVRGGRG
jgi:hypothetical protein